MRDEPSLGALTTERGALPLEAVDVRVHIDALLFKATLRQTFVNTLGVPLEATYVFPLPDRCAVAGFQFEVQGRTVIGRLDERQRARDAYDAAIAKGQRAGTAEEERPGVFTTRIGNLQPRERAVVELTLEGICGSAAGEACFRFPLVVAPRFVPGTPLEGASVGAGVEVDTDAAPDASRISPPTLIEGAAEPVRLSLEVTLEGRGLSVSDVRASQHELEIDGARVRLKPGERMNRDFTLTWRLGAKDAQSALLVDPTTKAFVLLIAPKQLEGGRRPRDVVFVLDRSGSMRGWKMTAARRGVQRMIEALGELDHVQVIAFDDVNEQAFASPTVAATDANRCRAVEFVDRIDARGGTQLAPALNLAAKFVNAGGAYDERERSIVLVTDGQVANEDQILRELDAVARGARVHALGIDQAPNAGLLARLARAFGGHALLTESEDAMHGRLEALKGFIVGSELVEPVVTLVGAKAIDVAPALLPSVSEGHGWLMCGRYEGREPASAEVRGTTADGRRVTLTAAAQHADVARVWARERIRMLEDQFAQGRGHERGIVETSLKYGVLSRFTAFVGIDPERVSVGAPQQVMQPVERPRGWASPGLGGVADRASRTRAGVIRGKYFYLSPELLRGEPVTAASMTFALAVTLYEALTGRRLFNAESELAIFEAISNVKLPERLFEGALAPLEAPFRRALQRNSAARGTVSELAAALEAFAPAEALAGLVPPSSVIAGTGGEHEWLLLAKLATGGDSEVYAADSAGRRASVVRLLPHLAEEPDVLEAFQRQPNVQHPHVVELYERGDQWLAYELFDGAELRVLSRKQPLTPGQTATVARAAADAIEHAARHQLFIRDLSPEHVLIGSDGRVKLTGFGPSSDSALWAPRSARVLSTSGGPVVRPSQRFWAPPGAP